MDLCTICGKEWTGEGMSADEMMSSCRGGGVNVCSRCMLGHTEKEEKPKPTMNGIRQELSFLEKLDANVFSSSNEALQTIAAGDMRADCIATWSLQKSTDLWKFTVPNFADAIKAFKVDNATRVQLYFNHEKTSLIVDYHYYDGGWIEMPTGFWPRNEFNIRTAYFLVWSDKEPKIHTHEVFLEPEFRDKVMKIGNKMLEIF